MSKLRLERYIESLDDSEKAAVAQAVEAQHRPTLSALWRLCTELLASRTSIKPNKEAIFERIFGEPYSKENDYRLRHEYRLLVSTIEHVLAERHAREKLASDRLFADELLLEALAQRNLWAEFDDTLADALDRAARQHDYHRTLRLQLQAIAATLRKGMWSHERMLDTIAWIDRAVETLNRLGVTEYEHLAALRTATEHMLDAEDIAYQPMPPLDLEQTTELQQYYRLKRLAVRYTGSQRLEAAQACAELIERIATEPGTPLFAERISAVGTLGVLLMIAAGDYAGSAAVSRRALELAEQHGDRTIVPLLAYNYCSALMKAGCWQQVLDFLGSNPTLLDDRRVGFRFALLRSYAFVFLGDAVGALRSLPKASRRYPTGEYHYAWYLYAIIAFVRGDLDDALREIENLRKHFVRQKLRSSLATDYALVGVLAKFFAATMYSSPRRRASVRRWIEESLDRIAATTPHYRDYLPVLWLRRQLDQLN